MLLIVNSDEEERSVRAALAVINSLRHRDGPPPLRTVVGDTPWCHTQWAKPEYL